MTKLSLSNLNDEFLLCELPQHLPNDLSHALQGLQVNKSYY
jgi:hypothetical protein